MEQSNKNKHILEFLKSKYILLKIRNIKLKQDTLVFFIFLIISTTFWFLNALRENYGETFTIPVKYVNVADDESIISKSDETLKLRVRGGGYSILRQKISKTFSAVSIDVSRLIRNSVGDESHAFLLPRMQRDNIQEQLFMGLELESVEPDTLFITLAKIAKKKVAIKPNGNVIPEKQFILAGKIIFSPDSVEIIAPVNVIDTIKFIQSEYFKIEKVKETATQSISLEIPNEIIDISTKSARMTVPIESFSETIVNVPVSVTGLPDSLRIKTFPSEIEIVCRVGLSKFGNIKASDFSAVVDAEQILNGERPIRLRVRIDKYPEEIPSFEYSPYFVEYLIERKK